MTLVKRIPILVALATAATGLIVWFIRKMGGRKEQTGQRKQVLYQNVLSEIDGRVDDLISETIYIDNAGLVLTGPFLPRLFEQLDLLGENEHGVPRLRDSEVVSRAVHLLQYLVDGRTDAPDPSLVLNKIMCGVPTDTPVERAIELTEEERGLCERLLTGMIANWKIIENTSIACLRETFLRREGRLESTPDGWELKVQRKTLDVLVDQIPGSVSVIFNKWMPQVLRVTW